tara:strand:+ start:500 stop:793 length:294 start_codon:yes stop_codon:yes gene_type:complete
MTNEEYKKAYDLIESEFQDKKKQLAATYANSNNPYKIGDVITDHICSIKIDKIKWCYTSWGDNPACMIYYGVELKANGEPTKKQKIRGVHQSNIILK